MAITQVWTLTITPKDPEVDFMALDFMTCMPFNLTIQDSREKDVIPIYLGTNITGEDIKRTLDRTGSTEVFITTKSALELEVAFVFGPSFGALPPTLALDSDNITISCTEIPDDRLLMFDASLTISQRLIYPNGFNLSFDSLRFTPNLPVDTPSLALQEALGDLLTWQCEYHQVGSVLLYNSYEEDGTGVRDNGDDIPRAYCGHYSRQSPGVIWESNEVLQPQTYVR